MNNYKYSIVLSVALPLQETLQEFKHKMVRLHITKCCSKSCYLLLSQYFCFDFCPIIKLYNHEVV